MEIVIHLLRIVRGLVLDRERLVLENLALRHQVAVLKRVNKRPRLTDADRAFWVFLMAAFKDWKEALHIVRPETVVRWHREGFRRFWRWRSQGRIGRPPIPMKLIFLIKRIARENPLWGAPHVQKELALLGHDLAESTVAKYMPKVPRSSSRRWSTFLRNHMDETAACDFFTVPTLTFKVLYVFVVIDHARRRILHFNVTSNPTDDWTALQVRQAFMFTDDPPTYLLRDRDSIYGESFLRALQHLGMRSLRTSPRSPWQNPFAERVVGTLRRECTDHIIPLGEDHLRRVLAEFIATYYHQRPHMGLDGDSPIHREPKRNGDLISKPVLNGLHHTYARAA